MNAQVEMIQKRQSRRAPFDTSRGIPPEHLREILESARWSPTAHNMQNFELVVVQDRKLIEALASIKAPVSEVFVRENYEQLSFSEEELKRKKVGILGSMFPPAWRTPGLKPSAAQAGTESAEGQRPSQTQMASASSAIIVVLYDPTRRAPASEGDFLGIISLGCVMQSMWLTAESLGIGFQILSSFSSEKVADEVKRILKIPESLRIAFTARIGYPLAPAQYLRVRREIGDFAHSDRYGVRYRESR